MKYCIIIIIIIIPILQPVYYQVQFTSSQSKMASMRSEKPICATQIYYQHLDRTHVYSK